MDLLRPLLMLLSLACAMASCAMRTLYKGPVGPPAPGEAFDIGQWLKSAMPKREDRCPGAPEMGSRPETTTPAQMSTGAPMSTRPGMTASPTTVAITRVPGLCYIDDLNFPHTEYSMCSDMVEFVNCFANCILGYALAQDVNTICDVDMSGSDQTFRISISLECSAGDWTANRLLGVIYRHVIPDSHFNYSSGHGSGRLLQDSWCPLWEEVEANNTSWLSVELNGPTTVHKVMTQAHESDARRVLAYKLAYRSSSSSQYKYIRSWSTGTEIFTGNLEPSPTMMMISEFNQPVEATSLRLEITDWAQVGAQPVPCLRIEFQTRIST